MKLTDTQKEWLKMQLYNLDWIKILDSAIKNRMTSWGCNTPKCFVVREWRNASDEILYSLLRELESKKILLRFGSLPKQKRMRR